MNPDSHVAKIFGGSIISGGSGLFAAITGDTWWVVLLGIAAGIALGVIGIRERDRLGTVKAARDETAYWRRQAEEERDRTAALAHRLAELGEEPSGKHKPATGAANGG